MFGLCFVVQSFLVFQSSCLEEKELVALLSLSSLCQVAVGVLLSFLVMPWVGLQCVIVAFPGHTVLPINKIESVIFLTMPVISISE